MIIDAHAHVYDYLRGYGAKGEFRALGKGKGIWANGEEEQFIPEQYGDKEFLAETLLKIMKENQVDHAVLLQGGNYGFHNDYTAEVAARYPSKFTAVGTVDPYCTYAMQIFENLISRYKMKALKFELSQPWGMTGYHLDLRLDNKQFAPIFSRANELGMTIVIDLGPWGTEGFQIEPFYHLLKTYPNIRFVMTHCFFCCNDGNNEKRLDYMRSLVSDRFVFDISNLPIFVWPEAYPYPSQQEFLRKAKAIVGADRMIWGTDVPSILNRYSYGQMKDYIMKSDVFSSAELEKVMAKNAVDLYQIMIG